MAATMTSPTHPTPDLDPARPRARRELVDLPAERLEAEILGLSSRLSVSIYELLVMVGELDGRGTWATWGALSCAAWVADSCDLDIATARTYVRVARALRTYPALDDAMADGTISYAKARVMAAHLSEDNIDDLMKLAKANPAGKLGAAIAAWSLSNEDEETIRARQKEAQATSWHTRADGMTVITSLVEPARAGGVIAAIDTKVMSSKGAPAGASLARQRTDALVSLVTGGGADVQAEVVIHVTEDGNRLPDGTPLSNHAVTELLPDAFVSLLLHDAERQPIDASPRRRTPTRRQRRVVDARHDQCQHPGCHARAFLQYDHIEPYAQGGPTEIDNLQRLCGPHNRAREARRGSASDAGTTSADRRSCDDVPAAERGAMDQ